MNPVEHSDTIPEGACQIKNVWDLVILDPEAPFYYRLKEGNIYLWSETFRRYEVYPLNNECRDFRIEKYIKKRKVYFKETAANT